MFRSILMLLASLAIADVPSTPPPYSKDAAAKMEERKEWRVGEIEICGNTRTRQSFILKRLNFCPGQKIDSKDLRAAAVALGRTKIFKGHPRVTIMDEDPQVEYCKVIVTVEDRATVYPWDREMEEMQDDFAHCLVLATLWLSNPKVAESVGDLLDEYPVFKAHFKCEPLFERLESVQFLAVVWSIKAAWSLERAVTPLIPGFVADKAKSDADTVDPSLILRGSR